MIDFEALFDRSPNAYVVLDRDLRIVAMNDAYLRATNRRRDEIIDRKMFDAFPSDEASDSYRQLMQSFERVLTSRAPDELAHIRYDIPGPDGTIDAQYWSATHTPLLGDDGEVALILQHTVNITQLASSGRADQGAGLIKRALFVEQRALDMARETEQMRNLLEQTPGFMAVIAGPEHRFALTNAAYRRLLGNRPHLGRTVAEAVPEVVDQGFVALLDQVFTSGEPYFGQRDKVVFQDEGAAAPRETFLEFIFQPIRDDDDIVWGILIQGHDVTEQVEAGERQRLLINELNHRVKNTLAVVQGLAQQSFGKLADGRFTIFSARLAALAGAHNLLTEATWEAADLRQLVYSSLDATAGLDVARCELRGDPVTLPPPLALSLAMVMHELSTNAIKYGALSNGSGRIAVEWSTAMVADDCVLTLTWTESGGPPVERPEREGFGTRLIRRGLGGHGSATLDYPAAGLVCRIEARL